MTARTRSVVLMLALVSPVADAAAQESIAELRSVLRKLEDMQAAQAKVLQQLDSLERQLSDVRRLSSGGPARTAPRPVPPAMPLSIADAPRKGSSSAEIVLLEYADFQCPYCGEFARYTLPEIERRYVTTGQVQLAFRNLPLQEIHPQALMAAAAAECAAQQGRFWEVHDALFMDQRLDEASLMAKVRSAGLTLDRFSACLRTEGPAKVRQDLSAARALGLAVTPTFLIGRRQADGLVKVEHIITGIKDVAAFAALLDPMLAESPARK